MIRQLSVSMILPLEKYVNTKAPRHVCSKYLGRYYLGSTLNRLDKEDNLLRPIIE